MESTKLQAFAGGFEKAFPTIKKWGAFLAIVLVSVLSMLSFLSATMTTSTYEGITTLSQDSNIFMLLVSLHVHMADTLNFSFSLIMFLVVFYTTVISSTVCLVLAVIALIKKKSDFMSTLALINLFANLTVCMAMSGLVKILATALNGILGVIGSSNVKFTYDVGGGMVTGLVIAGVIMAIFAVAECWLKNRNEKLNARTVTAVIFGLAFFWIMMFMLGGTNMLSVATLSESGMGFEADVLAIVMASVLFALHILVAFACIHYSRKLVNANLKKPGITLCVLANFVLIVAALVVGIIFGMETDITTITALNLAQLIVMALLSLAGVTAAVVMRGKSMTQTEDQ